MNDHWTYYSEITVQITFIFLGNTQTRLEVLWIGLRILNAFGMNRKFTFCVCLISEIVICEHLVDLVSFETNISKTAGQIHEIELVYRDDLSLDWAIMCDVMGIKRVYKWNEHRRSSSLSENQMHLSKRKIANTKIYEDKRDLYCKMQINLKITYPMIILNLYTQCLKKWYFFNW